MFFSSIRFSVNSRFFFPIDSSFYFSYFQFHSIVCTKQFQVVSYRLCNLPILNKYLCKKMNYFFLFLVFLVFFICTTVTRMSFLFSSSSCFLSFAQSSSRCYPLSQFFCQASHKNSKILDYILLVYFQTFESRKVGPVCNKRWLISLLFVPYKKLRKKNLKIVGNHRNRWEEPRKGFGKVFGAMFSGPSIWWPRITSPSLTWWSRRTIELFACVWKTQKKRPTGQKK